VVIHNPIIIIGTGRCGSTVFHELLSHGTIQKSSDGKEKVKYLVET